MYARKFWKRSAAEILFDCANILLMIFLVVLTGYPILYLLFYSLSGSAVGNELLLWPKGFSLGYYKTVLQDSSLVRSLFISAARTVIGPVLTVIVTSMAAFVMADKKFVLHKFFWKFFIITMFIGGGMIPYYLLMQNLGLYGNFWVYIIPSMFGGCYNMILMKTYIESLPTELFDAAHIDGANDLVKPQYEYMQCALYADSADFNGMRTSSGIPTASNGYGTRIVTTNCVYPERIFELYDWLSTKEGFMLNGWGIEGEDWEYDENGNPEVTDEFMALSENERKARGINVTASSFLSVMYNQFGCVNYLYGSVKYRQSLYTDRQNEWIANTADFTSLYGPWGWDGDTRIGERIVYDSPYVNSERTLLTEDPCYDAWTEMEEYTKTMLPKLFMADSDEAFYTLWDEVLQTRASMAMTDALELMNSRVAETNAKLGIGG